MLIHELASTYRNLAERLQDVDDDQALAQLLGTEPLLLQLNTQLETSAEGLAMLVDEIETTAEAVKGVAARYQARAGALNGAAAHLRACLLSAMQTAGMQKIKTPRVTLSVQNRDSLQVADEYTLDYAQVLAETPHLVRTRYELKKTEAKDHLGLRARAVQAQADAEAALAAAHAALAAAQEAQDVAAEAEAEAAVADAQEAANEAAAALAEIKPLDWARIVTRPSLTLRLGSGAKKPGGGA